MQNESDRAAARARQDTVDVPTQQAIPTSKYVETEAKTNLPFSDESIIEYCYEPRSKEDIENYFGISQHLCYKHINKLVGNGKIKYTKSTMIGNKIYKPRLIKA